MGKIKEIIRRALAINPGLYDAAWMLNHLRRPSYELDTKGLPVGPGRVFDLIYERNLWDCPESKSGFGSTLSFTRQLRADLQELIRAYEIESMLDAPCGDFNWMQHLAFPPGFRYIGGDIVKSLIDEVSAKHSVEQRRFVVMDVTRDTLPTTDLWLCRDCLFHLPNSEVIDVLRNFKLSGIRYLLTTTFRFPRSNLDVTHGGFRYINLTRPPFNLPRPIAYVKDYMLPFAPRWLGLWSRDQLANCLPKMSARGNAPTL